MDALFMVVLFVSVAALIFVVVRARNAEYKEAEKQEKAFQEFSRKVSDVEVKAFVDQVNTVLAHHLDNHVTLSVEDSKRFMYSKSYSYRRSGYVYVVNVLDDAGNELRFDTFSTYDGMSIFKHSDYYTGDKYVKREPAAV